ncbi:MAG: hypothetical protein ACN6I5_03985 [Hyphomicrobiales bacterium]
MPSDHAGSFQDVVSSLLVTDGRKAEIRLTNGVHVEFSGTQRPEGGSVLILEDVTERARAQERIKAMARFDSLTELPNRTHFGEVGRSPRGRSRSGIAVSADRFRCR